MSSISFVQQGQALLDRGQVQEAVKVCRLGLLAHPTALEGRLVLAAALLALRRYDEVLAEMRVALEIDGSSPRALTIKGEALLRKGDGFQAAQVLHRARIYSPSDRHLLNLCREAEIALSGADPSEFVSEHNDSLTKHYPTHRGLERGQERADSAENITTPLMAHKQRYPTPSPALLAIGDRSGTIKIDPMLDMQLTDDGDDALAEPPGSPGQSARTGSPALAGRRVSPAPRRSDFPDDSDIIEFDSVELGDSKTRDVDSGATFGSSAAYRREPATQPSVARPLPRPGGPGEGMSRRSRDARGDTSAYRKPRNQDAPLTLDEGDDPDDPDDIDYDEATRAVYKAPVVTDVDTGQLTSPDQRREAPRSRLPEPASETWRPSPQPGPRYVEPAGGPALDELFPEDESGISRVLLPRSAPGPGRAAAPAPQPGQPGMDLSDMVRQVGLPSSPTLASQVPSLSKSSDMRVIRAGLGLEPEGSQDLERVGLAPPYAPPPQPSGMSRAPQAASPLVRSPAVPVVVLPARAARSRQMAPLQDRTASVPLKRSRWIFVIYGAMALVVMAGGVLAGLEIRTIRLERQIRSAERDAVAYARGDTYDGYLRARAAYAGIVTVRADEHTRAQLAYMQAALAAEFGEGLGDATGKVAQLTQVRNADALAARAYLAVALGDAVEALARARELETVYPDDARGAYLIGRALMLADSPDDAVLAFRKAADRTPRPAVYAGLGIAHLGKNAFSEAKAAFERAASLVPGYPAAILGRARIAVASRALLKSEQQPEADLQALIAGGVPAALDGATGADGSPVLVAPRERALAALLLVSAKLARGDMAGAKQALGKARELAPRDDRLVSRELVQVLIATGDVKAARVEAERAAKLWPERPESRVALAELALLRGDAQVAIDTLGGDLGGSAVAQAVRGRAYLAAGKLDQAAGDLDAALASQPTLTDAVVARAELDLRQGDTRAALERLTAIYTPESPPSTGVVYAWALRAAGKLDEARTILSALIDLPDAGRAYFELARLEQAEGDYLAAQNAYRRAIEQLPEPTQARLEEGLLRFESGDLEGAREALRELAKAVPENSLVLLETAHLEILSGDLAGAAGNLAQAEKLASAPPALLARERGRLALARGQLEDAVGSLTRARILDPDDTETRMLLINAQFDAGNAEEARKIVDDVLKHFPDSAAVRDLARGRRDLTLDEHLAEARGAFEKARDRLKAQNASPRQLAEAYSGLSNVYRLEGNLQEARKASQAAVDLNPSSADAWFFRGLTDFEQQKWKGAAAAFARTVEIDPSGHPEAWYNLGMAHYNQNKRVAAREAFEKYVELRPTGDLVEDAREQIQQLR